jgi:predicted GH43/DUF377 family glycosyl hydrolase
MPPKKKRVVAKKNPIKKKVALKRPAKKVAVRKKAVRKISLKKIRVLPAPPKLHPEFLRKHHGNPIIEPRTHLTWESKATFNPGALEVDGKVHLLYRAIGDQDVSVVGHAISYDGLKIDERTDEPAYVLELPRAKEKSMSSTPRTAPGAYLSGGGGWGGCEDPRATLLGDKIYLTYTAFDGWGSVRVALASISTENFLQKRWLWDKPTMLSPAGQVHKNWVLFPEKINGKYAILHSMSPKILVAYVDDLDTFASNEESISSHYDRHSGTGEWDSWVRGIGPPPIKTKDGWLLLYHAMDTRDPNRYKLGAMLVDLQDPTKILSRSRTPVLEPEEWYENTGWKSGVVYACGAIVKEGVLFVYYGGADSVVCVATADLEEFLEHLKKEGAAKLTPGPKARPIKSR